MLVGFCILDIEPIKPNQMRRYFYLLPFLLLISCQTYRSIVPSIAGTPRYELKLKDPIIIALKDSRANTEQSTEVITSLKSGLRAIYGNNIEFQPFFESTGDNQVAIKINIKEIGAKFGIRSIQYQSYMNQVTAVSSSVSNTWGSAVSTAIVSQPVPVVSYSSEGYWIGTSYLDISLVDNLHQEKRIYNFPYAGEDKQSNAFGYKSADIAAQNSWNKVSSGLLDFIDAIALRIIEGY